MARPHELATQRHEEQTFYMMRVIRMEIRLVGVASHRIHST
jgi:hypothetical protein